MTPEKNNSVKKEVNKIKSAVAKNVFRVGLAGSILLGSSACVPTEAIFTTPTPEVSPLPSDFTRTPTPSLTEANYELTPTPENLATQELTLVPETEVATEMPTIPLTPEPTVNPDIEIVDEELAENIKNLMPEMWFYNDKSKNFEARDSSEFNFMIYKKTKLLIFDKDGNEVGFARYFARTSPDAEMTDYFSLTDISSETVIPLRIYSEMGNYTAKSIRTSEVATTKQCMFSFVEEFSEFRPVNKIYEQIAVDKTLEYAPDSRNIQKGEKMIETAILRVLTYITNISEEKLFEDLQKGLSMEFETNEGKWVVNKGINYIWSDSQDFSYELLDGELFLYNGFADTVLANDAIEGCRPMSWDIGFRRFLGDNYLDNYPEVVNIYLTNAQPYLDRYTRQTPVIVDLRKD